MTWIRTWSYRKSTSIKKTEAEVTLSNTRRGFPISKVRLLLEDKSVIVNVRISDERTWGLNKRVKQDGDVFKGRNTPIYDEIKGKALYLATS